MEAPVISVAELMKVFRDKLTKTGSLDAAFTKAVWIAYNAGLEQGLKQKEDQLCLPLEQPLQSSSLSPAPSEIVHSTSTHG
jgi:hypothetical protein